MSQRPSVLNLALSAIIAITVSCSPKAPPKSAAHSLKTASATTTVVRGVQTTITFEYAGGLIEPALEDLDFLQQIVTSLERSVSDELVRCAQRGSTEGGLHIDLGIDKATQRRTEWIQDNTGTQATVMGLHSWGKPRTTAAATTSVKRRTIGQAVWVDNTTIENKTSAQKQAITEALGTVFSAVLNDQCTRSFDTATMANGPGSKDSAVEQPGVMVLDRLLCPPWNERVFVRLDTLEVIRHEVTKSPTILRLPNNPWVLSRQSAEGSTLTAEQYEKMGQLLNRTVHFEHVHDAAIWVYQGTRRR